MKKIVKILLVCFMFLISAVPVKAEDSATASGYGYTLKGKITDTYISASATGEKSSDVNVSLTYTYYVNTAGNTVPVASRSAMTYISYYGSSIGAAFWKWSRVTVTGTALSSGGTTALRTLIN